MLHYFYGEDTYRARQAIAALAQQHRATIRWLDHDDLQHQSVADTLGQSAGLFGATLLVVRDVSRLPMALQAQLLEFSQSHPQALAVLWDRTPVRRPSLLMKRLAAQSFLYEPRMSTAAWLNQAVQARGGTIAPSAALLLIDRLGSDRWQLLAVVEKMLITHTAITPAVVAAETQAAGDAEIFAVLTAIVNQRPHVLGSIKTLLAQGNSELYILSMLAWQFKVLTQVRQGSEAGLTPAAIASRYQLKPFVVAKSLAVVTTVSSEQLLGFLTRILATDVVIKQGRVDARTGLLMLVVSLVT